MGLFDELPAAKRAAPEPKDEPPPSPKRVKTEDDAAVDAPEPAPPAREPAVASRSPAEALEKLTKHCANPGKFNRASALAVQLMRGGELERKHGKALFALLEASMTPNPAMRACEASSRFEYRELFEAARACEDDGVFNAKQRARIAVWSFYAIEMNALYTDDNFQFAKSLKGLRERVEAMTPWSPRPSVANEDEDDEDDEKEDDEREKERDVGGGADADAEDAAEARAHAARMRLAERAAAAEAWDVEEASRVALLDALDAAAKQYKFAWAQTAIDVAADLFHERRDAFGAEHAVRIVATWELVRDKKNARRGWGGGGGGEDATAFDRGAAMYKGATINLRKAVGSERGGRDGRGESALPMFG